MDDAIFLHANIQLKPGSNIDDFYEDLGKLAEILRKDHEVLLVSSYRVGSEARVINVWRVPSREVLDQLTPEKTPEIRKLHERFVQQEDVSLVEPRTVGSSANDDRDYNVLLVDPRGVAYYLDEDTWKKYGKCKKEVQAPGSVLHRNKPSDQPGLEFVCWFVNLKLLNEGLMPRPEQERKP